MQIKSILKQLDYTLGVNHSTRGMVLIPGSKGFESGRSPKAMNFVVGYNGSVNSQAALDLTLWIAHQTRQVTRQPVTVHVVYVVTPPIQGKKRRKSRKARRKIQSAGTPKWRKLQGSPTLTGSLKSMPLSLKTGQAEDRCPVVCEAPMPQPPEIPSGLGDLAKADCILWQARCLAEEWRGSLEAHLRFGDWATEMQAVVQELAADGLVLGCVSPEHPLVAELPTDFPCPVLGLPIAISSPEIAAEPESLTGRS
jgi:hypothetical protein